MARTRKRTVAKTATRAKAAPKTKPFNLAWPVSIVAVIIVAVLIVKSIAPSPAFTIIPPGHPSLKLYVATSGLDSNTGLDPAKPLRSILKAAMQGADIVVLEGTEYQLPPKSEHTNDGQSIPLEKSIMIVSDQTPWEHSPSSSNGGYTTIVPPKIGGRVRNEYHILRLRGKYLTNQLTVKFIRFSDTELQAYMLSRTTYQGD
ncbi:MAG: hypothetical protein V1826_00990 [bacterium]